jgi:hypothetical protein
MASTQPWRQARFNPLRRIIPNGKAITTTGHNRHTNQPVNEYGLTFDTDRLRQAILTHFPDTPTRQNYAVDRLIRGGNVLSDHARGEALDLMIPKYDGLTGISDLDRRHGRQIMDWIVANSAGPLKTGLRNIKYRGQYRVAYVLFDGSIWYAAENVVRPLKPGSNQHRDHVHVSIVPEDRRATTPIPEPAPPRRTVRYGDRNELVRIVQATVGAHVDGTFGRETRRKVVAYQNAHNLYPDGIVGQQTWAVIDGANP